MKTNMFEFITKTHNPLGGGHVIQTDGSIRGCFNCSYCWARGLIDRHQLRWLKYFGRYRTGEKELVKRFKPEDFVFAFDMADIGHPGVPYNVFVECMRWVADQPCKVLLSTKNPGIYTAHAAIMPSNAVLGTTIETDMNITLEFSEAPVPSVRLAFMALLASKVENDLFISVEPIMKFSEAFAEEIKMINPWAVAIGYDNHKHKLPEPTLAETEGLIASLEEAGITVYRKTIRPAWDEEVET